MASLVYLLQPWYACAPAALCAAVMTDGLFLEAPTCPLYDMACFTMILEDWLEHACQQLLRCVNNGRLYAFGADFGETPLRELALS